MKPLIFALLLASCGVAQAATQYHFDVYLDQSKVGSHRFNVEQARGQTRVESKASVNVKILLFTAFRYEHEAREVWKGDCLTQVTSSTDNNGEPLQIKAKRVGKVLAITTGKDKRELPGCVRSFAYWNPRLLDSSHLLNPQDGKYEKTRLKKLSPKPLQFKSRDYGHERYRLEVGDKVRIDLWYDRAGRWQALQTQVSGGRTMTYLRREG